MTETSFQIFQTSYVFFFVSPIVSPSSISFYQIQPKRNKMTIKYPLTFIAFLDILFRFLYLLCIVYFPFMSRFTFYMIPQCWLSVNTISYIVSDMTCCIYKNLCILNRKADHIVYNSTKLLMKIMYKIFRTIIYNSYQADSFFYQVALHGCVQLRRLRYAIEIACVALVPHGSIFRYR